MVIQTWCRFKGTDDSRGYRSGKHYTLAFEITAAGIRIYRTSDTRGLHYYKTLKLFSDEWTILG